jgi:fructose-1,6-bisphosphatase/inositol monophosphatase family enzyme
MSTFSTADTDSVVTILRDAARDEILPRFRGLIPQTVREKSSPIDLVTDADEAAERAITAALARRFPGAAIIGEEASARDPSLMRGIAAHDLAFIIDPIDGTKNFSAGLPLFGVMAAVARRGEIVAGIILDPIEDDAAIALRGEGAWIARSDGRRSNLHVGRAPPLHEMTGMVSWLFFAPALKAVVTGNLHKVAAAVDYRCAAHQYRMISAGTYDFTLYSKLMPWDHAPGWLLHREAGGYSACLDGEPYDLARQSGGMLCAPDRTSWEMLRAALIG